jgi:hypothetical protein
MKLNNGRSTNTHKHLFYLSVGKNYESIGGSKEDLLTPGIDFYGMLNFKEA